MNPIKTLLICLSLVAMPTYAALEVGDPAPSFDAPASLAGQPFDFSMDETLKEGPVVLYFYPKAFTPGCTVEANEFAKASDDFAQYGATILGVSADDIETLHEFSVKECSNKFAVAADPEGKVIQAYDAQLGMRPELAARISYVISPEGEILNVHEDMQPQGHITESLATVKNWHESQ